MALASVLLHLGDEYNIPDFALMRRKALVSLVVMATAPTAKYVSSMSKMSYSITSIPI